MPNFLRHPAGKLVKLGGVRRDPPGHSDLRYGANQFQSDDLPPFVDLRPHMTAVEDQGELSSCTANALAGALEYLEKRITSQEVNVSRLFIYWNEREVEGETDKDEGAVLRNGVKALKTQGACAEEIWPYDPGAVFEKPHDVAYQEGANHTIDEAHKVDVDVQSMRHCLSEGYPFVFGLEIFKSFEKDGHHGRISMPTSKDKSEGGHAMLCVGYSDEDQVFLVRNSWGPRWGDGGYCYIPYDYLADPDRAHDFWTIRKAHNLDFSQGVRGVSPPPHGTRTSFFSDLVDSIGGGSSVISVAAKVLDVLTQSPSSPTRPVAPVRPAPPVRPTPPVRTIPVTPPPVDDPWGNQPQTDVTPPPQIFQPTSDPWGAQPVAPPPVDDPWAPQTQPVTPPAVVSSDDPWATDAPSDQPVAAGGDVAPDDNPWATDPAADATDIHTDDNDPANASADDDTTGDDTTGDDTTGDDTTDDDTTDDDTTGDDTTGDDTTDDDNDTADDSTDDVSASADDDTTDDTDDDPDDTDDDPDDDDDSKR